jgi:hypothetical protein
MDHPPTSFAARVILWNAATVSILEMRSTIKEMLPEISG